jgi:c-di-GMP-binding flagellar brake protein YcgR
MSDLEEKRKFARLNIRSKINFSLQETPRKKIPAQRFRGVGINIGAEGLLFLCNKKLEKGTLLDMEIFFPGKPDPVYISGEIRWCRETTGSEQAKYSVGVKFSSINKNHVLMLVQYVCGNLSVNEISSLS